MRGKGRRPLQGASWDGIIPAGAGKREDGAGDEDVCGDHPRGCGEKFFSASVVVVQKGSSPRVRGKGEQHAGQHLRPRIIPAGAGKRPRAPRCHSARRDHPRGCGEKTVKTRRNIAGEGSSPRVRGKALRLGLGGGRSGIIPAGAGKSDSGWSSRWRCGDHPRGCGEKHNPPRHHRRPRGSSPRVRGKGIGSLGLSSRWGIIPAGAGKRTSSGVRAALGSDHPRGCGEKYNPRWAANVYVGSSPRVRGKGRPWSRPPRSGGIIPAGAGKRAQSLATIFVPGDHPRGCGEKRRQFRVLNRGKGSSPRVRGKVKQGFRPAPQPGIIPAGAGKRIQIEEMADDSGDHPRGCGEKA